MGKKSNLPNVDDLHVKYVFDELDPSEITLVERAMSKDQNVLIEVHSMKSTWKRIKSSLSEVQPPEHVTRGVLEKAQLNATSKIVFWSKWNNPGLLATAAVILFSFISTVAYFLPVKITKSEEIAGESAVAIMELHLDRGEQPWIDRENMMYIGALGINNKVILPDSLRGSSIQTSGNREIPRHVPSVMKDFQLTGTRF